MNESANWALPALLLLEVARTGSLTSASQRLGLSQPTVSRQLQALEERLGARLLVRHARGVRLTERARELVTAAEGVERAMDGFARLAAGVRETIAGTVRLAASEIVGVEVLAPRLGELSHAYPDIEVELVLANTTSDLATGDADLAVRLYRPQQSELVSKLIGSVELAFFAAGSYLERRGMPRSLDALLEHTLIGFDRRGAMAGLFAAVDPRLTADRFAIRTDSLTAQLAAARAGCGIAAAQVPIAARYPELVRLELPVAAPAAPFWLTSHADLRRATHVRVVWTWCEQVLRDYCRTREPKAS
jgi:DNA-binding transcriptional LysR family regulator